MVFKSGVWKPFKSCRIKAEIYVYNIDILFSLKEGWFENSPSVLRQPNNSEVLQYDSKYMLIVAFHKTSYFGYFKPQEAFQLLMMLSTILEV